MSHPREYPDTDKKTIAEHVWVFVDVSGQVNLVVTKQERIPCEVLDNDLRGDPLPFFAVLFCDNAVCSSARAYGDVSRQELKP